MNLNVKETKELKTLLKDIIKNSSVDYILATNPNNCHIYKSSLCGCYENSQHYSKKPNIEDLLHDDDCRYMKTKQMLSVIEKKSS